MSDKNLRDSTKKVRENQIKRSEIEADIKNQKKKSKALQKQIREEESVFLKESLELAEYTVEHFETSSEESGEAEEVLEKETFDDKDDSSVDDVWDPLGVIKTPRKIAANEGLDLAAIPSASWSTKVNQFFPQDCESTPRLQRREVVASTSSAPPSPVVCLEKITEESIHSKAGDDEELSNSDSFNNKVFWQNSKRSFCKTGTDNSTALRC